MRRALILTALALAACSSDDVSSTVVGSSSFPSVGIECRSGVAPLSPDACRDWAEQVLMGSEELLPRTVRVILTRGRERNARCAAEFFDSGGRIFASASTRCPVS